MDNNLGLLAILLLLMAVLPLSGTITPAKNRTQNLCVEGSWVKVGSYRFWKRAKCVKRRQIMQQPTGSPWPQHPGLRQGKNSTKAPSTVNLELILPSLEGGPERNKHYNPNYGHEPYWANGDWVFDKDPYKKDTALYMCGIRCPTMYSEYGRVCGRDSKFNYKSFVNYCQLRNEDCSALSPWRMVYKGNCYFKFVPYDEDHVAERTKAIIKEIENKKDLF